MTWNHYSLDLESSTSNYSYVADNAALSITGDMTLEAWIKIESLPVNNGAIEMICAKAYSTGNQRSWNFGLIQQSGVLQIIGLVSVDGSAYSDVYTNWTYEVGKWYHVAMVYNTATPSIQFFANGVAIAGATTITTASIYNSTARFSIGAKNTEGTPDSYFDGLVNNLRVWSDMRTAQELLDNRYLTLTGTSNNLVGSWYATANNHDDLAGTNNLTAVNTPVFSTNVPWTGANSTDWSVNSQIQADHTKVSGASDLTNFPVLIKDGNIPDSVYGGLLDSLSATGGTITTDGSYTVHTFTSSGTFTITGSGTVEYLVVAGGGGGGYRGGGGGGAGGYKTASGYAVTAGALTVTVGNGGSGGTGETDKGDNGQNSVFDTITSTGGGGGGSGLDRVGSDGGSGGGGNQSNAGGSASPSGQGNNGGVGGGAAAFGGGGGGGATAVGAAGTGSVGGNGGAGTSSSITGSAVTRGGGGGGGTIVAGTAGTGGTGGGANGSTSGVGSSGTANTGGGGGGGGPTFAGGVGGSGIVIIRYIAKTEGQDLRITTDSAGTTEIPYEIVSMDTTAKTAEVWAKIPTLLTASATSLYLWAGNANAIAYDANAPFGSQAVWSAYKAVYHLQSLTADSTSNAYTLTNTNSVASSANLIGNGADFSATNSNKDLRRTADNLGIDGGNITISGWFKLRAEPATNSRVRLICQASSTTKTGYTIGYTDVAGTHYFEVVRLSMGVVYDTHQYSTTFGTSAWHYLVLTYDATGKVKRGYLDGVERISNTITGANGTGTTQTGAAIASGIDGTTFGEYTSMYSDEARYTSVIQTGDWIATEYANQNSPSTFWVLSSIKSVGGVAYAGIGKIAGVTRSTSKKVAGLA